MGGTFLIYYFWRWGEYFLHGGMNRTFFRPYLKAYFKQCYDQDFWFGFRGGGYLCTTVGYMPTKQLPTGRWGVQKWNFLKRFYKQNVICYLSPTPLSTTGGGMNPRRGYINIPGGLYKYPILHLAFKWRILHRPIGVASMGQDEANASSWFCKAFFLPCKYLWPCEKTMSINHFASSWCFLRKWI